MMLPGKQDRLQHQIPRVLFRQSHLAKEILPSLTAEYTMTERHRMLIGSLITFFLAMILLYSVLQISGLMFDLFSLMVL